MQTVPFFGSRSSDSHSCRIRGHGSRSFPVRILYNFFRNRGLALCKPLMHNIQVYTVLCITLCIVCKTLAHQGFCTASNLCIDPV